MKLGNIYNLFKHFGRQVSSQIRQSNQNIFKPSLFLSHPLAQSIYNITQPYFKFDYHRQKIFFDDGGFISLDWAYSPKSENNKTKPVIFVMHGLTGGSNNNYLKVIAQEGQKLGYQVVCMNSRGVNNQMTSPIPFTATSHHQMQQALKRILIYYPNSPIYLVGTSFGGNYIMRYVINNYSQLNSNIKGLVALAPPFDIGKTIDEMPIIYQRFFLKRYLNETVFKHQQMKYWEDIGIYNLKEIKKSKTLRDFHSRCVSKILGFSNQQVLYKQYLISNYCIEKIKIPTLIMVSKDDPIVSYKIFPRQNILKNSNIKLLQTEKGGHVCWFQGFSPKRWYTKPILQFVEQINKKNSMKNRNIF